VGGVLAPSAAKHALLVAAHSWAHEPLRLLRDIVDDAAISREADPSELQALAAEWSVTRLLRSTDDAARRTKLALRNARRRRSGHNQEAGVS
jgi:hypothetical protein